MGVDNLSTIANNKGKKVKVNERKFSSIGIETRTGDTNISGSDTDLDSIKKIRTKRPKLV